MWIGRTNALFTSLLGTCAGMSLLHIVFLSMSAGEKFNEMYGNFATSINMIFLILSNLVLFLGITLALIYKQSSWTKIKNQDN